MDLQLHLIVFLGWFLVNSAEVDCLLLVIYVKSDVVDGLPCSSGVSVQF